MTILLLLVPLPGGILSYAGGIMSGGDNVQGEYVRGDYVQGGLCPFPRLHKYITTIAGSPWATTISPQRVK
jgi:hypothetical protein